MPRTRPLTSSKNHSRLRRPYTPNRRNLDAETHLSMGLEFHQDATEARLGWMYRATHPCTYCASTGTPCLSKPLYTDKPGEVRGTACMRCSHGQLECSRARSAVLGWQQRAGSLEPEGVAPGHTFVLAKEVIENTEETKEMAVAVPADEVVGHEDGTPATGVADSERGTELAMSDDEDTPQPQIQHRHEDVEVIELLDSSDEESDLELDTNTDNDTDTESASAPTRAPRAEPLPAPENARPRLAHHTSAARAPVTPRYDRPVLADRDIPLYKAYIAAGTREALHDLDLASELAGISKTELQSRLMIDRWTLGNIVEVAVAPSFVTPLDCRLYELYIEWGTMAFMAGVAEETGFSEGYIYGRAMVDQERLVAFLRALFPT